MDKDTITASWVPDLFGPIFEKDRFTLTEALRLQDVDEQIHMMATFLPDEIIRGIVLSAKSSRSFATVLLLLNTSGLCTLCTRYIHDENMGSLAFTTILNNYIGAVAREVYRNEGDVLKFTAGGLLASWKVRDDQFTFDIVERVIECAIRIRDLSHDSQVPRANIAISAGDVTLSVIGNDEVWNFVVHGAAIDELKYAGKTSQPNDLVLSFSAWKHCTPSRYEYVVKDYRSVKIIKILVRSEFTANSTSVKKRSPEDLTNASFSRRVRTTFTQKDFRRLSVIVDTKQETPATAISALTSANPSFCALLKSYLMKSVYQQVPFVIEKAWSLDLLTAITRVTTVSLDIVLNKYTSDELLLLVDKCFLLVHSVVTQHAGCIDTVNLNEKSLFFRIMFAIGKCDDDNRQRGIDVDEACRNGINCALQVLRTVKSIARIYNASVGVATGLAYCGIIGNTMRNFYAVMGPSVDRATWIMDISYDKISCDFDTVLCSRLSKDQFRPRGLKTLGSSEMCQVFEYLGDAPRKDDVDSTSSMEYCYPILGRQQELDEFDDILDEIGVAGRSCSGLLIEGGERSGKSRLLDAFVASARNRQIRPIELSLHATYAEKTHAAAHHVILQILEADDCDTIAERQKVLLAKLAGVIEPHDLCYINDLLRIRFPLSDAYCIDSDKRREEKTISIFEAILKQNKTKICIFLDDVQHMDSASWRLLSSALDNNHVVVAMTMLTTEANTRGNTNSVQTMIRRDKRLLKRTLDSLDPDLLPALACQFLNVLAIPRKISGTLLECAEGHVGWCETYLTLLLQNDMLDFVRLSPNEAGQRDLVFPDGRVLVRLPVDLTPQELPPPPTWSRMSYLDVCVANQRYSDEIFETDHDIRGLMCEIYERMSPFERSFVACSATLGTVFRRNMLLYVMPGANNNEHDAANIAISEMFRMRILECASHQRRDFYADDLILCILKKRRTFSDMRHLVTCNCRISRQIAVDIPSPLGAHCKTLEFKVDLFRKMVYDMQPDKIKRQHHSRAAEIYSRDARKCSSCGSGTFFRFPSEDVSIKRENNVNTVATSVVHRRTISVNPRNERGSSVVKRSGFLTASSLLSSRRRESVGDIRRVSIMPMYLDGPEDKEVRLPSKKAYLHSDVSTTVRRSEEIGKSSPSKSSGFWRRGFSSVAPEITRDYSWSGYMDAFNHIDYRNCRCDCVIGCLFWRLHQHIEHSGEVSKIVDFLIEYSSGLIQVAQPSHAIKLLAIASENDENTHDEEERVVNRGIILALTGDAYSALGNYAQAKRYYAAAVTLRGAPLKMHEVVCYGPLMTTKIHRKLLDPPRHATNEKSVRLSSKGLELASYTRRLSLALKREDKLKAAKLFVLQSFKAGFLSFDGFLEKGEIYLATVQVSRRSGDHDLTRCIDKPMLSVIETKLVWNNVEEIEMLAKVYFKMYQVRALNGELEDAVHTGIQVLRITGMLHLSDLSLAVMPSLIEIMLWTKYINQTVDLMRELYFLAEEDVDLSAKTWYYALSLELLLDAGIFLESYETSLDYYQRFIANRSKSRVVRDPQSCCRLLTCLWIYQLRMGYSLTNTTTYSADAYVQDIDRDHDLFRIFTCCKGLEYYLLVLLRCVNTKDSDELIDRVRDVYIVINCLSKVSSYAKVVKPRLHLLMAYLNALRGRKSAERLHLRKARKLANAQGNKLMEAWCIQNKRTWAEKIYNNMARYWLEYAGSVDFVAWQHICNFSVNVWSTILYPLPIPDTYL